MLLKSSIIEIWEYNKYKANNNNSNNNNRLIVLIIGYDGIYHENDIYIIFKAS